MNASVSLPLSQKEKSILAIALSWAAGFVDVLGYLALSGAFVAHMSGNTVSSVLYGAEGNGSELLHRVVPIPAFFLGLLAGELVLESAKRTGKRRIASRVLAMEAACLALFLILGIGILSPNTTVHPPGKVRFVILVALIALAMGMQSASLRKIGALTIFTTFITGTLTKLANDVSTYLFWVHDQMRDRNEKKRRWKVLKRSWKQQSFQDVVLLTSLYFAYALGALAGAAGFHRWGIVVVVAPLGLVVMGVLADIVRPIAPMP